MKPQQPTHQYLIRFKDLEGNSCEQSLYASNPMEARNLVMSCNSDLGQRPNLINAILKTD
jgi:hypothetical protein